MRKLFLVALFSASMFLPLVAAHADGTGQQSSTPPQGTTDNNNKSYTNDSGGTVPGQNYCGGVNRC